LFCASCGSLVPVDAGEVAGLPLVVVGRYAPPLSTAIGRFKYEGRADLAPRLAALLEEPLAQRLLTSVAGATLVPVPLHPRRLAERGYNQAALLASALANRYELASSPRLLARRRETERQVGKNRNERLANALDAFEVRATGAGTGRLNGASAERCRAILVDDVVTTGATVRACAQALRRAGIEPAGVVALARANAD
jgi:ComF family protein